MRDRPNLERAESRFVVRYHKLYEPLIELIQSLEDLLPPGYQLGDSIELSVKNGNISVKGGGKPVRLVLHDAKQTYVLEVRSNPSSRKQTAVD